jgi:hypothetical protein
MVWVVWACVERSRIGYAVDGDAVPRQPRSCRSAIHGTETRDLPDGSGKGMVCDAMRVCVCVCVWIEFDAFVWRRRASYQVHHRRQRLADGGISEFRHDDDQRAVPDGDDGIFDDVVLLAWEESGADWRSFSEVKELGIVMYNCSCLASDLEQIFQIYWRIAAQDTFDGTFVRKYRSLRERVAFGAERFRSFDTLYDLEHPATLQLNGIVRFVRLGKCVCV